MTNSKLHNIGWIESLFLISIAFFFAVLLFYFYKNVMPYKYGDTAFLIEVITNLSNGAPATSEVLTQNAAEIMLARAELSVYCQQGLVAAQFSSDPFNVFSLHAYVILYLIAPLARVFGTLNTLSAIMAIAFTSIPCIAYVYLRKSDISIPVSILSVIICVIHPAWLISSNGQFYVDRIFIPFALLYAIILHQYFIYNRKNILVPSILIFLLLSIGVIGGITSERNMLILGMFSLIFALVMRTQSNRRISIIGFSLICFVYVLLYIYFFGGTTDNARVQKSFFRFSGLINALMRPGIGEYLWFNLMLLAMPALITPRIFITLVPIVAINCFITVGGAEKNGWATHYHSHYYGFLVASFLISIAYVNQNLHKKPVYILKKLMIPILVSMTLLSWISVEHYYKEQGIFVSLWDYYLRPEVLSASRAHKDMFDNLANHVPTGVTLTTTEWGMAAWYLRGNKVNVFPIGIGSNDYVMVQADGKIPNIKLLSAVRFKADTLAANECFASVISSEYKELGRQGTWVLFEKKH